MSSLGRRAFACLLLASGLAFAAACGSDLPTTTKAPEKPRPVLSIDPNAYYVVRNVAGKVMDVSNNGCCNGAAIHIWTYEGQANQQWRIVDVGGGYYKFVARHSGRVLDVESGSQGEGAKIHQWAYEGLQHQQWSINSCNCSYGAYYIAARHSGKAATINGGSVYSNGTSVKQISYSGYVTQLWYLDQVP
jgi:Ricin-type beta-trefoil lectin domain-like